jgi:hypothetical protein
LCIVAPSEEYLGLAGVRIRYRRIAEHLARHGHGLEIEVIDQFRSPAHFVHDAYVFSKCYDERSVLIGQLLRGSARIVGIDMFDDYFSQRADARFVAYRDWLRSMAGVCDFFLCSTQRMQEVVRGYMPDLPGHVLNDPYDDADATRIALAARRNLEAAHAQRRIAACWFGVGDNPHFEVGLHDLHAFGNALARLQQRGWDVHLSILTNRRALGVSGLERLQRLPVRWDLDEWTEERERELLARSLVAFIPVNAQAFSIAKSLNRAISALTAGTQVLSNGYPLYAPLDPFIYGDPSQLLDDLTRHELRLRDATLPALLELLGRIGDPNEEARRCAAFLESHSRRKSAGDTARADEAPATARVGVLHGVRSLGAVHQMAQRLKQLSIGSPFAIESLNYDLRFALGDRGNVVAQLSEAAATALPPTLKRRLTPGTSVTGKDVHCLDASALWPQPAATLVLHLRGAPTRAGRLVGYGSAMVAVRDIALALFPSIELLRSEIEVPYHAAN